MVLVAYGCGIVVCSPTNSPYDHACEVTCREHEGGVLPTLANSGARREAAREAAPGTNNCTRGTQGYGSKQPRDISE